MQNGFECPPPGRDEACLLGGRGDRKGCRRVNSWIEWLVKEGGKGKTRDEIKEGYHNRGRQYTRDRFCQMARGRGKTHDLSLDSIGNPVLFYSMQPAVAPLNLFEPRRHKILKELKKTHGIPLNFDHRDITIAWIRSTVQVIDDFYFDGSLVRHMNARLDRPLEFAVGAHRDGNAVMFTSEWYAYRERRHRNQRVQRVRLTVDRALWTDEGWPRRGDGIRSTSKLHSFVVSAEHELVHLIQAVWAPRTCFGNSHGLVFRVLHNRIFGHSDTLYRCRAQDFDVVIN